jgi:hypothetical protein
MRLTMTKYDSITLTIIIVPLTLSPLFLLFLVRLVVYIVNLFSFYSYSLIGKLRKGSSFWFVYYEEIKGELKKILEGLFVMKRQRER